MFIQSINAQRKKRKKKKKRERGGMNTLQTRYKPIHCTG